MKRKENETSFAEGFHQIKALRTLGQQIVQVHQKWDSSRICGVATLFRASNGRTLHVLLTPREPSARMLFGYDFVDSYWDLWVRTVNLKYVDLVFIVVQNLWKSTCMGRTQINSVCPVVLIDDNIYQGKKGDWFHIDLISTGFSEAMVDVDCRPKGYIKSIDKIWQDSAIHSLQQ